MSSQYVQRPSMLESQFLQLELHKPSSFPHMFFNDERTHCYRKDGHLVIEVCHEKEEESALGMDIRTVYEISNENVMYFGPARKECKVCRIKPDGY